MAVETATTPNPMAMKLMVGAPVGGPGTLVSGAETDIEWARGLLGVQGVASIFFTADFITITKSPTADWGDILAEAVPILEAEFGA